MILLAGYLLSNSQTDAVFELDARGGTSDEPEAQASGESSSDSPTNSLERGSTDWIAGLESAVHQLVNFERQRNFLPVLSQDSELADIASAHSKDMAPNGFFEHENPAGQLAADRGNAAGYRCLKDFGNFYTEGIHENLSRGWYYSSFNARGRQYFTMGDLAFEIVDGWMNSPGHRENILTETYDREGVGISIGEDESVWVTQNF